MVIAQRRKLHETHANPIDRIIMVPQASEIQALLATQTRRYLNAAIIILT